LKSREVFLFCFSCPCKCPNSIGSMGRLVRLRYERAPRCPAIRRERPTQRLPNPAGRNVPRNVPPPAGKPKKGKGPGLNWPLPSSRKRLNRDSKNASDA